MPTPTPPTATLFLPNTKPPRHIIRTLLRIRLRITLTKQALHILILCHLPPLIALVLLPHNLLRQRCRRRILDAVASRRLVARFWLLVLLVRRLGVLDALLALLAAGRFLECVGEVLFAEGLDA